MIQSFNSQVGLEGRTAIVTGAASGIGRAIASVFLASGARVYLLDVNHERVTLAARQLTSTVGEHAQPIVCDVTDLKATEQCFAQMAAQGRIDILVNSAGVSHIGRLDNTTEEDFDRLFRVNVKGVFHAMQAAIGPMQSAGGGVIVNLASIAATAGLSDRFAYSMTKGAVLAMTLSVARDYLAHGIRCNCISPARIHTPFVDDFVQKNYPGREAEMFQKLSQAQPIGRMGTPEEVAALALFLCSDQASFLTGADIPLDGGFFNLRG